MTDIDTIREALEEYRLTGLSPRGFVTAGAQKAESALAALKRVSALNSEMEAALKDLLHSFTGEGRLQGLDSLPEVRAAKEAIWKSEQSR